MHRFPRARLAIYWQYGMSLRGGFGLLWASSGHRTHQRSWPRKTSNPINQNGLRGYRKELTTGIEPVTSSLPRMCSTD